jgi:hypothetical protein
MNAGASLPIDLDRARAPVAAVAPPASRRAGAPPAGLNVSRPIVPWRWRNGIVDASQLVAVVLSIPIVIVAIGAPLALAIVALLRLARWTFGAV